VIPGGLTLSALLNPTVNPFKRFGPDTLPPWLIDWALDNRSAMVTDLEFREYAYH
jgi:glutamine synthetase